MGIKNKNKESGFTLLEVLVSIVIFVIGILGLMALQVFAVKGAYLGERTTEAVELANSMINEIQATPYNASNPGEFSAGSHPSSGEGCLQCPTGCNVSPIGICGNSYSISWTVTPQTLGSGLVSNNVYGITLTVSWTDGVLNRSVTMYTSKLPL